jgi:hypothetical protein
VGKSGMYKQLFSRTKMMSEHPLVNKSSPRASNYLVGWLVGWFTNGSPTDAAPKNTLQYSMRFQGSTKTIDPTSPHYLT